MCSWHEDLFESAIPLSINYSTRLRSVPLLVSHHLMPLIVRFVILQDSSPFLFFLNPFTFFSPFLPSSPVTCQVRCVTPRKIEEIEEQEGGRNPPQDR